MDPVGLTTIIITGYSETHPGGLLRISAHFGLLLCSANQVANTIPVDTSFLTGTKPGPLVFRGHTRPAVPVAAALCICGPVIECLRVLDLYGSPGNLSQWDYFLHLADKETERLGTMSSGEDHRHEFPVPGDLGGTTSLVPYSGFSRVLSFQI